MPKSLNSTMITLVPKKSHAKEVGDYRPIACCNIVQDNFKNALYETEVYSTRNHLTKSECICGREKYSAECPNMSRFGQVI